MVSIVTERESEAAIWQVRAIGRNGVPILLADSLEQPEAQFLRDTLRKRSVFVAVYLDRGKCPPEAEPKGGGRCRRSAL